jgi:ABC-type nitrate/sulfonate/bicarbonate transport system permease component
MDAHDTALIFATLMVASTIGILLSYAIVLVERFAIPWQRR